MKLTVTLPSSVRNQLQQCKDRRLSFSLVAGIAALVAAPAVAQEKSGIETARALFAMDAGTWDGKIKMFLAGPAGPPTESEGVEENDAVSGGIAVRSKFTGMLGGLGEFKAHSLMGYDTRTDEFIVMSVDNVNPSPSLLKGSYDEQTKTLELRGTVADGSGNELKQKQVVKWIDESTKQLEIYMLIETGETETEIKLMEMLSQKRP